MISRSTKGFTVAAPALRDAPSRASVTGKTTTETKKTVG